MLRLTAHYTANVLRWTKKICGPAFLCALLLHCFSLTAWAGAIPWTELEKGMEYAEFDRADATDGTLVCLRFDPAVFTFRVHSISEEGGLPLTLRQWADKHKLVAAINASMYLPDGRTSTGYMRHHEHLNSKRIVGRFGAFFVAQLYRPTDGASPSATLLDKDLDPWEEELPKYVSVVQNYRMINAQRRVLWSPGGPLYSISAVGKDGAGNILFIHCREPIEAYTFAALLLDLPIDIRTVMYVEGGAQAGLLVNTSKYARLWAGRSPMDFLVTGNINAPLPNILGVVRSHQAGPPPPLSTPPGEPFVGPPKGEQGEGTQKPHTQQTVPAVPASTQQAVPAQPTGFTPQPTSTQTQAPVHPTKSTPRDAAEPSPTPQQLQAPPSQEE